LSQKRLKPSLGNINVHRRETFVRELSASEILRDKSSSFCFIYVCRLYHMVAQHTNIHLLHKKMRVKR